MLRLPPMRRPRSRWRSRRPIPRGRPTRCARRSRSRNEGAVADATHGRDVARAVGGVSEPLAQAPYVDIDRAIDRFAIRGSVERVEERVSREHATFGFDERDEQAEFERGKRQALTAAEHLVPLAVDDEVAEPQRLARLAADGRTPEDRLHADD